MENHLTREQMLKYRDRQILPSDQLEADRHLSACESCRAELAALSLLASVLEARDEHITYEQMDAWVEGSMDSDERELVMSHVGLCPFCAQQLQAYEQYSPAMSATVPPPAQPVASFGGKIRAFFRTPQFAVIAAGLVVAAILSPLAVHRSTATAPMSAALEPESIRDLPQVHDKDLNYPVSEVVEERQPILQWKASSGEVTVYLYDAAHHEIAHSPATSDTHWLVPVLLDRGAVYNWEVRTAAGNREASFRVLSDASEKELVQARASNADLKTTGQLEENLGLLSLAEQQFSSLVKENPDSKDAADLLKHVQQLQGH